MKVYDKNGNEINLQEIEDTGWIELSSILRYRVLNNLVFVQICDFNNISLKYKDNYLGNIPEPYRPSKEVIIPIHLMGISSESNTLIHSRITIQGDIYVYLPCDSNYCEGFASYPVG